MPGDAWEKALRKALEERAWELDLLREYDRGKVKVGRPSPGGGSS